MYKEIITNIWENRKVIGSIAGAILFIVSLYTYMNNIEENRSESNKRISGYKKWKENVLNDNSQEAEKLRGALGPNNSLIDMYDLINDVQAMGVESGKNAVDSVNVSSDIPSYIKKPMTGIIKSTIDEKKSQYYIKFVDDEGGALKDKSGKEMIYRDGQKIILQLKEKPYKYVFINNKNVISFVDNSDKSKWGDIDIMTIPITYTDDESIAKTLYNDIKTLQTGKTKLNIIYGNPNTKISEVFKYHLKFDLVISEQKSNFVGIVVFIFGMIILILGTVIVWRKKFIY